MQRKHMRRQSRASRPGLALAALAAGLAFPQWAAGQAGTPPPVVVVALDASGSLSQGDIARARALVSGLLRGLPAGAEVAVFSVDDESRLLQPRTSSHALVLRALDGVERRGRFTALHDALYYASRAVSRASAVSIGRARANDIVLQDVSISSQHCRIRPEEGPFVLHDLDSTNGTFVNDKRVRRQRLADGDRVQVGATVMQFRTDRHV